MPIFVNDSKGAKREVSQIFISENGTASREVMEQYAGNGALKQLVFTRKRDLNNLSFKLTREDASIYVGSMDSHIGNVYTLFPEGVRMQGSYLSDYRYIEFISDLKVFKKDIFKVIYTLSSVTNPDSVIEKEKHAYGIICSINDISKSDTFDKDSVLASGTYEYEMFSSSKTLCLEIGLSSEKDGYGRNGNVYIENFELYLNDYKIF